MADPIDQRFDLFLPWKQDTPPGQTVAYGANWRELELWQKRFREAIDRAIATAGTGLVLGPGIPSVVRPDIGSSTGVTGFAADAGHIHGIGSDVPLPVGPVLDEGVSQWVARSDHVHTYVDPTPETIVHGSVGNYAIQTPPPIMSTLLSDSPPFMKWRGLPTTLKTLGLSS